ncbi:conserved hypothetical protein [Leishmania major strain Friedlin]|uniref:Uncharacterized protein n=1 Tax=Leishmania major TaxID=5664 RepID=E9AEW8_LEIMA|nr:conserved hypothetical protein [Leishmania major strain Friedlin]CAG9582497.1 hypothetical_protein_-_conserved [Leishmania major strain Friedlin]CBZ12772.1 conserved hypothetical protein [Leishmania major strain Friedlin]|eukprot:XP_003722538.1 conserved hypothetical protein [Leishmania major strain Friedlin]
MLSTLRIPVHEEPEEEAPASPDPYATSPFRGASPSIVSMVRAGSISSENMPPPPDIQHIEGQLWFVTGKNGPGKKHASAQWVVCEDQRLSVYSSWANSRRLVEEARFERVRIMFDFLHPHMHPEVMGSGAPQTRRMTIHRNEPRTTAESRCAFHIRDPCDAQTLAGYYYFGVECVMRDPLTVRLRRSLAVFCTDHPDDHRKWLDFWEEMQVRYPMLRNRNAAAMSMDISSELMSEFVFPAQAVKPAVGGKSEEDTDAVSSPGLPSPIGRDEDSLATTRAPKWTDSEHGQPHWKGDTRPLPFALLGSTSAGGVRGSLLSDVATGGEDAEAGGSEQWLALLVDAERQAREGIELIEAATRSMLEANQALRDLFHHVTPTATVPSPVAVVCRKDEGSAGDDAVSGVPMRNGDMMRALQAELRALCAALERAKSEVFTSAPAPEALTSAESAAVSNQVLLAAHERELTELRVQNATLRRELDTHAATAAARVERALDEWTLTGTVDIVVSDAENGGSGQVADAFADRQRYLAADKALVRALVEAALVQESSTAALDSSGGAASPAQVNTQGESASTPQAFHATLSTDADGYDGVISAGRLLGTASDSRQLCRAHSGEVQLSDATSAAGDLTASLPALVRQHLSTFATEHDRRLGSTDLARSLSTDRDSLLYHVVDEVVTAFKDLMDAPHIATGISKADGNVTASAPTATAVSSWLSVLHRCLLHRLGVVGVVCSAGASIQSPVAAAEAGGPATDAASAVEAAAAGDDVTGCGPPAETSSNARQCSSLPPLTDEEIAIVGDLHQSVHDVVAWILNLLGERQRYAAYMTALDSLTCRHDVFRPLKEVQGELERATARFEAAAAAASPSSAACGHGEATNPDTFPLEAAAASSAAYDGPEDSEKHTSDGSDGLRVECRLTARLQHATAAFDSKCEEAAALRRLLTAILYGSEMALQKADSTDEVVPAATTSAAAACEAFRAAQEAGVGEVDKLRGAAEACVAARAREEVWASTLTPAVLQACADAFIGAPCIQDMVHALQLTLGRCPEIHGRPRLVGDAAYVPPLPQESIWSLAQELHQRLAVEQARCNGLLGEVMLISSSLACVGSEPLTAAYSTAMTATANASAMTNEALKAWAAYTKHAHEVVPGQQRDLHEPVETKADRCLSAAPAETTAETAPHEVVHARLVAALSRADGARGLRSAAFDVTNSLLPNLLASIAGTQTALWRLVGVLLRHGAGAGVPSPEVVLALPIVNHIAAPHAIGDSATDVSSLGAHIGVAGSAAEELLSECEKAASERREWMQQFLQWLKDVPLTPVQVRRHSYTPGLRYDASTAHEVYAQLLEELAAAESEHMSRVGAVEALLWKTSCVRTIFVPEMSDGAGDADIAALAAAAAADIAETLRVAEAHVSVTAASADPVQRAAHVSATIAHDPRGRTRASVLGTVHACPFARLQEALKGAPVDSAATASDTGERSTAHPATVDSPEGIDAVSRLARSLQHRAAKMAAVVEFEKRVLALLPSPHDIAMANAGMPTIDGTPACKAVQALAAMLADELDIPIPEANFKRPSTAPAALLDTLASYLEQLHDAALSALHHRQIESGYASLEKLRAAVDTLHDAALEKVADVALEQIPSLHDIVDMPWPEALKTADLRHIHLIIEHLASGADRAASPDSTNDQLNDLRAIAQALGVPPDAYAGERDGECVPTIGQLAERAGAVVSARAEEAAGLRAIAQALAVPPDAYAGERDGECAPTTGQLAERAGAVVSARAEEAAGLRAIAQALAVPPDAYAGERDGECAPTTGQLAERAGAVVSARAEEAAGLRAIAQALGVPPDAYAGERDGECVPTTGQLAERAGAVVSARAEEAAGLRAIAQALGVPPDAYAGERDGECVPTTGQLAERAGAVVSARAEEAAGLRAIAQALGVPPDAYGGEWTEEMTPRCSEVLSAVDALVKRSKMACEAARMDAGEGEAAVGVLVALWEAVEEAGVLTANLEDGWWSVEGRSRWEAAASLVGALSAAVEVSHEELADVSGRIKFFEEELVDVERDHNESRETITAAVKKLRGGLEEVIIEDPGETSPPSSRGSTVCGPLFTSLRQLTSEVSDVASVLRRVKQVLEEHNAEEKCMPELEEVSFPVSQKDGCDVLEEGKVLTYEDVVAGVRAKVVALRKERARRIETDAALKNFLSAVTDRRAFSEEQPVSRPSSLLSRRCVKPKAKPQPADLDSSASEEFFLPRTPLLLPTNNGNTDVPLGCSGSISVPVSRWAASEALEKVRHQMNQAENAIGTLRTAVAAAYEALGGEDDAVHASDNEAARLLVELARNTAESIEFVKRLLEPLDESEASTRRREQLAHLVDRIKEKLGSSSGASMPTLLQVEEGMHSLYNDSTSSRRSPGSSVNRHLPRKQKPVAPEVEFTKGFHLTQQVVRNRDSSASSLTSTLKVLVPPPPGTRDSTEDVEKEIGYRMQELDALRRGCSVALRTLDSSLNVSDMDCNAMITHLVECCSDVQTAMQITAAVFEDDNMISEVSAAASSYRASNPSASEHPLPMRCSVLVRTVKSLDNLCEAMRHTQANMAKQQRFLMQNEAQNTGELRRALVELEQQLLNGNAERLKLQKAKEAAEKNAAELSHALEMAHNELTNLQNIRDDLEKSLVQLKQQHGKDDDELDRAGEKLNSLSNHATTLQAVLEAATDAVRKEVLGPCQQLHLAVVGREMPKPEMLAEGKSQEVLLPALHAIAKALQNAVEEMTRFATGDTGIAAVFAEERKHAAQRAAVLKSELASVAEAKEEAEARAKAAAKHLKQTEDAFEDEVAKLKRALRNSEAMLEEKEANHQRRLRQAQAAAEDQLALVQQRLDRVTRAQTEEERLRAASEENVQKLRGALAEAEAELARQQRYAAEDTMTQRKGSMHRIDSLEADLAAARLHSSELAQTLGRARRDSAEAARTLETEAREKAKLAEELADTRAQLRAVNNELASICASIASTGLTSSIKSSAFSPASPERATELLAGLVDHVAVLQRALEAQETARQQHRTKGTQSEDAVAETLAAFAAIWAAAVKTGCTPARLNEACLTPTDKAEVLSNALTRDVSLKLDDLAATRQRLLDLLCHPRVRHLARPAALGPLEKTTTAALVQTYHDAMERCHEAQQAALERELRDAQCRAQNLLARLQEQEEQHAIEAEEVEIRIGRMREMVQSKLMADEIAEQHMQETDAAMRAHFLL